MYYFYLGGELMPVTPSKMSVKIQNNNKTISLASGGEVNILKSPGLTEISFDLLLPSAQYDFTRYDGDFKSPNYYLEYIEKLKNEKRKFQFTVIRMISAQTLLRYSLRLQSLPASAVKDYDLNGDSKITTADARILLKNQGEITVLNDTNIQCSLEDYTITEDAEKYGRDFFVSLKLKQYREYGLKTALYNVVK